MLDSIDKYVLMEKFSFQNPDLEDASPIELSLPYARCLDKRFKGEKFNSKELEDQSTYRMFNDLDLSEIQEGYDDVYLTAFKESQQDPDKEQDNQEEMKYDHQTTDPIEEAHTLIFTDDEGCVHILDLQRLIVKYGITPAKDQTKRNNYFPSRIVKIDKNVLFTNKTELHRELEQNTTQTKSYEEKLSEIPPIYHYSWKMFDEVLTMLSVIEIPNGRSPFEGLSQMDTAEKVSHGYLEHSIKSNNKLVIGSSGTTIVKIYSVLGESL